MSYTVTTRPRALRELQRLPIKDRQRARDHIDALADDPRPPGSLKLTGQNLHRIRVGDYRILYEIDDARRIVLWRRRRCVAK